MRDKAWTDFSAAYSDYQKISCLIMPRSLHCEVFFDFVIKTMMSEELPALSDTFSKHWSTLCNLLARRRRNSRSADLQSFTGVGHMGEVVSLCIVFGWLWSCIFIWLRYLGQMNDCESSWRIAIWLLYSQFAALVRLIRDGWHISTFHQSSNPNSDRRLPRHLLYLPVVPVLGILKIP